MKKKILIICASVFGLGLSAQTTNEATIDKIIAGMSIEEKAGQMTNMTLSTIAYEKDGSVFIDMAKLKESVQTYHVGSYQNVLNHAYSIDEWHRLLDTIQSVTLRLEKHKVPSLYCIDAVHGTNYTKGSTLFPHNLAMAATRNPLLATLGGRVTAAETRATGIRYNFSPVLDAGRQPLWPRFAETFGEDVYLVKTMGLATIKGYQGTDLKSTASVAACMKHFLGYSVPASGRDRAPAYISDIQLREYFLPPFKEAVLAGTKTVMVNSAEVNGIPVHSNHYLLTDVLRTELGFKGVVITDWEDVKKLVERHRTAENYKEAVYQSVTAGIDLCIVPMDYDFTKNLIALVKEGRISEDRLNLSVKRILMMKMELGLFDNPYVEQSAKSQLAKPEYRENTLEAAREAITLLKNEKNILPLAKNKKVLVLGPTSNSKTSLNGCWSYTWQGQDASYFDAKDLTLLDAIKGKVSGEVKYLTVKEYEANPTIAGQYDYIIAAIGEDAYAETPGNIKDLELPTDQKELVKSLAKSGKPVIMVLLEGRPRIVRDIETLCPGIIMGYWPGPQGGIAIADVLFGDVNPSGKLPFTYPRYSGDILTYDHKLLDEAVEVQSPYSYGYEFNPQWQFGHGLSYTTFVYENLKFSTDTLKGNAVLKVSLTVKNTGTRAGKEAVELYTSDLVASITPCVKRLRKFTKINLEAGASKEVVFELSAADLAFVNKDLKWVTESGEFQVMVGALKKSFFYK
ncbi:MAG: glycoside hydrolase family 3 C-terminal domain-containing protein [Bacteroidetes bacterium]|nr:glycoside hydrolase family 3 C-terminal domain-containing protein [Bacteroidota bacterium]